MSWDKNCCEDHTVGETINLNKESWQKKQEVMEKEWSRMIFAFACFNFSSPF